MSTLYIGIDGGGTKSAAVLINENGDILKEFTGGPSNYQAVGLSAALQNLKEVYQNLLEKWPEEQVISFLSLAGIDTRHDQSVWQETLSSHPYFGEHDHFPKISVENDVLAALRMATDRQDAIAVISGTGSACFGRNAKGDTAKSSGMKQILADQGCGYDIGLRTLKQITKELDGRANRSLLTQLFFEKYEISTLEELHDLVYGSDLTSAWDKSKIGEVALLAQDAAKSGERWVLGMADDQVAELILMVDAVVDRLGFGNKGFDVAVVGNVLKNFTAIHDGFYGQVQSKYPQAVFCEPSMSPALAAAHLAQETH